MSGTSTSGFGVVAASTNASGIYRLAARADTTGARLSPNAVAACRNPANANSGYGVYASSATGMGLRAYSAQGTGIRSDIAGAGFSVVGTSVNGLGSGADFEGGRYGIVGRAQSSGYPLVLTDSSYKNVFYVTGTGDIYYSGNFYTFSRTGGGGTVSSFTAKSTEPTVEDTGSAQLTAGVAAVRLDASFAAAIDKSASYRVFITPDGDTRGLFVAQKTSRGFIVRETQGGRSNLAFDYRIVATSQGGLGKRMAVAGFGVAPDAPAAPRVAPLPLKVPPHPQRAMP